METDAQQSPDAKSADWKAMAPYWEQVDALVAGRQAVVDLGETFLPKFQYESQADYDLKLSLAKYTNVYRDIVEGLASKPFAQELVLKDGSPQRFKDITEDIDGRGNSLHTFSAETFFNGINKSLDWILVDYSRSEGLRTVEDERQAGVRPYWVHVPAERVIWIESKVIQGREQFTLIRILESEERGARRVRTYERSDAGVVTWKVEQEGDGGWTVAGEGTLTIQEIPMVPFVTGRRKGSKWQFFPPMRDAADLQVTLYQIEAGLSYIEAMTCYPMLAANGVQPDMEGDKPKHVQVGPRAVLYAPPINAEGAHGEWKFIEPTAASLKFMAEDIDRTKKELRELGRQPLTAQSGNLTVITTAFAAAKGNSAVQAWALLLQDALENAMRLTALWMSDSHEAEVQVFTDFGVDDFDDKAPEYLLKAREQGVISAHTLTDEFKRRGILGPEFDYQTEVDERLFLELSGGEEESDPDGSL